MSNFYRYKRKKKLFEKFQETPIVGFVQITNLKTCISNIYADGFLMQTRQLQLSKFCYFRLKKNVKAKLQTFQLISIFLLENNF